MKQFSFPRTNGGRVKKCNLEPGQNIVLFVGNLVKRKAVDTFIEALKNLKESFPDFYAIIIGQGEELEQLQSLVKDYALTTNVEFLGWLPRNKLSDFYSSADVFVLPSLSEGHSVAILEAMASGLPIIASKAGGNKESIEEGINGLLFETSNDRILAEKILTVLSDDKLKNQMSINSSRLYQEKFSSNTQIKEHLKLYNSLVC
jgi:glycosyltransferase involved in cell wall biosynthesis